MNPLMPWEFPIVGPVDRQQNQVQQRMDTLAAAGATRSASAKSPSIRGDIVDARDRSRKLQAQPENTPLIPPATPKPSIPSIVDPGTYIKTLRLELQKQKPGIRRRRAVNPLADVGPVGAHQDHGSDVVCAVLDPKIALRYNMLMHKIPEAGLALDKLIQDALFNMDIVMQVVPLAVKQTRQHDSVLRQEGPTSKPSIHTQELPDQVPSTLNCLTVIEQRRRFSSEALREIFTVGLVVVAMTDQLDEDTQKWYKQLVKQQASQPGAQRAAQSSHFKEQSMLPYRVIPSWQGTFRKLLCEKINDYVWEFTPTHEESIWWQRRGYRFAVYEPCRDLQYLAPLITRPAGLASFSQQYQASIPLPENNTGGGGGFHVGHGNGADAISTSMAARGSVQRGVGLTSVLLRTPVAKLAVPYARLMMQTVWHDRVTSVNSMPLAFFETSVPQTTLNTMTENQMAAAAINSSASAHMIATGASQAAAVAGVASGGSLAANSGTVLYPMLHQRSVINELGIAASAVEFTSPAFREDLKRQTARIHRSINAIHPLTDTANSAGEYDQRRVDVPVGVHLTANPTPLDVVFGGAHTPDDIMIDWLDKKLMASWSPSVDAGKRIEESKIIIPAEERLKNYLAPTYVASASETPTALTEKLVDLVLQLYGVPPTLFRGSGLVAPSAVPGATKGGLQTTSDAFDGSNPLGILVNDATGKPSGGAAHAVYDMETRGYGAMIEKIQNELAGLWEWLFAKCVSYYDGQVLVKLFEQELRKAGAMHNDIVKQLQDYEETVLSLPNYVPSEGNAAKRVKPNAPKSGPDKQPKLSPLQTQQELIGTATAMALSTNANMDFELYSRMINRLFLYTVALHSEVVLVVEFQPSPSFSRRIEMLRRQGELRAKDKEKSSKRGRKEKDDVAEQTSSPARTRSNRTSPKRSKKTKGGKSGEDDDVEERILRRLEKRLLEKSRTGSDDKKQKKRKRSTSDEQ